jgi:hypothetical protein
MMRLNFSFASVNTALQLYFIDRFGQKNSHPSLRAKQASRFVELFCRQPTGNIIPARMV